MNLFEKYIQAEQTTAGGMMLGQEDEWDILSKGSKGPDLNTFMTTSSTGTPGTQRAGGGIDWDPNLYDPEDDTTWPTNWEEYSVYWNEIWLPQQGAVHDQLNRLARGNKYSNLSGVIRQFQYWSEFMFWILAGMQFGAWNPSNPWGDPPDGLFG